MSSEYLWSETWTCPEEGYLTPNTIHLFHGLGGRGGGGFIHWSIELYLTRPREDLFVRIFSKWVRHLHWFPPIHQAV
ncbi:hypothetical protein CEXT_69511 [Caerostris extrusa]|uniref:Uncharacterized protein n=1 Tax=Caerostris extrusa TaxID=172846 RepID=A0AAV4TCC2_CAEEX|nr:hypothetical protein CEXT_69511 [Caerostris extrusa]